MTKKEEKVFRDAMALPEEYRAILAERLLESLEAAERREIDELWAREARDRIAAYERGEIEAIPSEEVFTEIEARLRS